MAALSPTRSLSARSKNSWPRCELLSASSEKRARGQLNSLPMPLLGRVNRWSRQTASSSNSRFVGPNLRAAAIEVDLSAMNVPKTADTMESLIRQAESGPQSQRIWALWTLGLLGNRGVAPERASQVLVGQLQDSNPEIRHWAVEGLAYLGINETIAPLLQIFHDDPSPMVRERAACSLAQSGMLTQEQRRSVIPQLLNYADDASLDAQTHTWVYHALRDITGQNLPNESAAWRSWYSSTQD